MAWVWLFIAGVLEVVWAIGLKYSDGFRRPIPGVLTALTMIASFGFLAQALRTLPIGTAYAIWTGIGAVGTAIAGMVLLDESKDPMRFVFIGVIAAGVVGLRLSHTNGG